MDNSQAGKVIFIILPDLRIGGAEKVSVTLANSLSRQGNQVKMILMSGDDSLAPSLDKDIELLDLGVRRIRQLFFPLLTMIRDQKPDVVIANMWPLTLIVLLAGKLGHLPSKILLAEHTTWSQSPLVRRWFPRWSTRVLMRIFMPLADGIICVSRGAAEDLALFSGIRSDLITTIYNPIELDEDEVPLGESLATWWNAPYRLLAVGSLKPEKDYPVLLRAVDRVSKELDVRLLIFGEGPCRAELENLSSNLGLGDRVLMPGTETRLKPFYEQANLFVLSSSCEGFGNVLVEAMMSGTPVVSTDCPSGPSEILADGQYGMLVPVGDVEKMAEAIVSELKHEHDDERLREHARAFLPEEVVKQWQALM